MAEQITHYSIDPSIFLSVDKYAIKDFIIDIDPNILDDSDNTESAKHYGDKLNNLILNGKIEEDKVQSFLLDSLLYGKMNQLSFYNVISGNVANLNTIDNIKSALIRSQHIETPTTLPDSSYSSNLKDKIKNKTPKLLYLDIQTKNSKPSELTLLIGQQISGTEEKHPIFFSIYMDLENDISVLRFKDWNKVSIEYNASNHPHKIESLIGNIFGVNLHMHDSVSQNTVKRISKDLIDPILNPVIEKVKNKVIEDIKKDTNKWLKNLGLQNSATVKDKDILTDHILNHLYGLSYNLDTNFIDIKSSQIIEQIGGYVSYIRFTDQTVSEAKAKSSNVNESLLDTNVYYDLKARLEESESIKLSTYQFLNVPGRTKSRRGRLGISVHTETISQFQCVLQCQYYDKEVYEYVLQKITGYIIK